MTVKKLIRIARAKLPTTQGNFSVYAYQDKNNKKEHLAFIYGQINEKKPVLARVHSACVTGDVFGSKRCDCQAQLIQSIRNIKRRGSGVLLYLDQEGRGIGLINKIKAYELQDKGLDTVEANIKLGFSHDERNYAVAADILRDLKITQIELMTNNPKKIHDLEAGGIRVARIKLWVGKNKTNAKYIFTKIKKLRHLAK